MAKQTDQKRGKPQRMTPAGPDSERGLEASEFEDHGRGSVDQNIGKAMSRKTAARTGGIPQVTGGDVGLSAMPHSAEARDHGHRNATNQEQ
jgi:hypothetical protein